MANVLILEAHIWNPTLPLSHLSYSPTSPAPHLPLPPLTFSFSPSPTLPVSRSGASDLEFNTLSFFQLWSFRSGASHCHILPTSHFSSLPLPPGEAL